MTQIDDTIRCFKDTADDTRLITQIGGRHRAFSI